MKSILVPCNISEARRLAAIEELTHAGLILLEEKGEVKRHRCPDCGVELWGIPEAQRDVRCEMCELAV
jgi:ribosomal protein S27E